MELEIGPIEDRLAELGIETRYTGDDDYTSYIMALGSRELEILDAVSGDYFRPADTTEAVLYLVGDHKNVTDEFSAVGSASEFVELAERLLSSVSIFIGA